MSSAKEISLAGDSEPGEARIYCELDGLPMPVDMSTVTLAGVFLNSTTPPEVDAEVELFIRHRSAHARIKGLVVRRVSCEEAAKGGGHPGCGILFTDLTQRSRAFLNSLVAAISGQNDGLEIPPVPIPGALGKPPAAGQANRVQQTIPLQATPVRVELDGRTVRATSGVTSARRHQVTAPFERSGGRRTVDPIRARMRAELKRQTSYAPYRVLGVAAEATDAEARTAYLKLSKEYHPHRYARYDDEELNALVTQVFIGYKRAYRSFVKERRRD